MEHNTKPDPHRYRKKDVMIIICLIILFIVMLCLSNFLSRIFKVHQSLIFGLLILLISMIYLCR